MAWLWWKRIRDALLPQDKSSAQTQTLSIDRRKEISRPFNATGSNDIFLDLDERDSGKPLPQSEGAGLSSSNPRGDVETTAVALPGATADDRAPPVRLQPLGPLERLPPKIPNFSRPFVSKRPLEHNSEESRAVAYDIRNRAFRRLNLDPKEIGRIQGEVEENKTWRRKLAALHIQGEQELALPTRSEEAREIQDFPSGKIGRDAEDSNNIGKVGSHVDADMELRGAAAAANVQARHESTYPTKGSKLDYLRDSAMRRAGIDPDDETAVKNNLYQLEEIKKENMKTGRIARAELWKKLRSPQGLGD